MTDHLIYTDFNESAFLAAGGANFHVPRAGSPSRSLSFIAAAGDDLAGRHGTTTTTDRGLLSTEECHAAVDDEGIEGEFETAHIFDADDTASREIICDCCCGLGHMRRLCPSHRNRQRSLEYAINMLQSKLTSHGSEPARRPPQGWWANVRTLLLDYTQEMGPTLAPKPLLARSNTSTETGVRTVLERC